MLVLTWMSCVFVPDCPRCAPDCADIAIRDVDGTPDGCDVAACDACADACGGRCMVLESYPPQYSCGGESWTVYDFCPDWSLPTGIAAIDVQDLGCGTGTGGESLAVSATEPGRADVTHLDYAEGCCPEEVQVGLTLEDRDISVAYTLVDDLCDCVCGLDVSYSLVGLDPGVWTLHAGSLSTTVAVP